jgi:hypothetical protein
MFSKRELEGYLMIDHRESPGITEEQAAQTGAVPVGKGMFFEAPTTRCNHCPRQIILNPLRTRERVWCSKCDRYLCDECALAYRINFICNPVSKQIDDFIDNANKGLIHGS